MALWEQVFGLLGVGGGLPSRLRVGRLRVGRLPRPVWPLFVGSVARAVCSGAAQAMSTSTTGRPSSSSRTVPPTT